MKRSTINALATAFGCLAAAMLPSPSWADPVSLVCRHTIAQIQDVGANFIEMDETLGTITVHFAPYGLMGTTNSLPARTVGPVHATFTPQEIRFENPDPNSAPNGGPDKFVLNRLTGDLTGLWGQDIMTCQAAAKRF